MEVHEIDVNGDGELDAVAVERAEDGSVTYHVDTTGDGTANMIATDADGDGTIDSMTVDTTGDGTPDTVASDTTGDGNLDTAAKINE